MYGIDQALLEKFEPNEALYHRKDFFFSTAPDELDQYDLYRIEDEAEAALNATQLDALMRNALYTVKNSFVNDDSLRTSDHTVLEFLSAGARLKRVGEWYYLEIARNVWFPVMWTTVQRLMRRGWVVLREAGEASPGEPAVLYFRPNFERSLLDQLYAYLESTW